MESSEQFLLSSGDGGK